MALVSTVVAPEGETKGGSQRPPGLNVAGISDSKTIQTATKELRSWRRIEDVHFSFGENYEWTVGVKETDGSSEWGYAMSVCQELRDQKLSDEFTRVRIVKFASDNSQPWWRATAYGAAQCSNFAKLIG